MANKRTAAKKKPYPWILVAVAAVVVCLAVVFVVNGGKGAKPATGGEGESEGAAQAASGEALIIPTAEVTTDASFYSVEVDGTEMEVIAVRDSQGRIRTAFNTCQICYSSGRGYYKQLGDELICQNCGNRFSMDQVEVESGGCNPWPIFSENKTETEDTISISYDFLRESKEIFANWKTSY